MTMGRLIEYRCLTAHLLFILWIFILSANVSCGLAGSLLGDVA